MTRDLVIAALFLLLAIGAATLRDDPVEVQLSTEIEAAAKRITEQLRHD